MTNTPFDPKAFTPYLLSIAAERTSQGFQQVYKNAYGMLRVEWRVLFHLGTYGDMTARDICQRSQLDKTKVSRAVAALRAKGFLDSTGVQTDRRQMILSLTQEGRTVFADLSVRAQAYEHSITADFTAQELTQLHGFLHRLADPSGSAS